MKHTGKGLGISLHGGTSDINAWKMRIEAQTNAEPPIPEFKPLKSYELPRAEERAKYAAIPSRYAI